MISTHDAIDIEVNAYMGERRNKMLEKLTQATSTEIQKTKVNNFDAFRLEIKGITSGGVKVHYLFTLIKTNNKLFHLVAWSTESKFEENRVEFEQLASAMQF
jgi:hypothetical protein